MTLYELYTILQEEGLYEKFIKLLENIAHEKDTIHR